MFSINWLLIVTPEASPIVMYTCISFRNNLFAQGMMEFAQANDEAEIWNQTCQSLMAGLKYYAVLCLTLNAYSRDWE